MDTSRYMRVPVHQDSVGGNAASCFGGPGGRVIYF
jgi:hypothetical protein